MDVQPNYLRPVSFELIDDSDLVDLTPKKPANPARSVKTSIVPPVVETVQRPQRNQGKGIPTANANTTATAWQTARQVFVTAFKTMYFVGLCFFTLLFGMLAVFVVISKALGGGRRGGRRGNNRFYFRRPYRRRRYGGGGGGGGGFMGISNLGGYEREEGSGVDWTGDSGDFGGGGDGGGE